MQSELLVEALLISFAIAKVLRGFLESGAEPRLFSDQVEDLGFARIYRPETIGGRERRSSRGSLRGAGGCGSA